jgi:hypothetical protein
VRATTLIHSLLDSEDIDADDIDYEDYISQADKRWNSIHVVDSKEWRAFFRSLGYNVTSYYRHKKGYAYFTMKLQPKDGHQVDEQDALLLHEYMFEFLEKRLKKKRHDLKIFIQVYAWSQATGREFRPGMNQIHIMVGPADQVNYSQDYSSLHPLYGWR